MYGDIDTHELRQRYDPFYMGKPLAHPGLHEAVGLSNCEIERTFDPALVPPPGFPANVILYGPSGCGKSGFAKALAFELGLAIGETSEYLMFRAARFYQKTSPCELEHAMRWLQDKQPSGRRCLVGVGDLITESCPDKLMNEANKKGRLIVGARRKIELEAWFKDGRHATDVTVEIMADQSNDDAYELKDWVRPIIRVPGSAHHVAFELNDRIIKEVARELASDILSCSRL